LNWSKKRTLIELRKIEDDLKFHRNERRETQRSIDRLNIAKKCLKEKLERWNPSKRKP